MSSGIGSEEAAGLFVNRRVHAGSTVRISGAISLVYQPHIPNDENTNRSTVAVTESSRRLVYNESSYKYRHGLVSNLARARFR